MLPLALVGWWWCAVVDLPCNGGATYAKGILNGCNDESWKKKKSKIKFRLNSKVAIRVLNWTALE